MSSTHATCDEVEGAIFNALSQLAASASPPGPFVSVKRVGRIETVDDIKTVTDGKVPACVLAFDRAQPEGADGVFAQNGPHAIETVERQHFNVFVIVANPGRSETNVKGAVGSPGVLALAQRVKEALAGLEVAGLFDGDVVHLQSHTVFASRLDSHLVHLVTFTARTELPPSDAPTTPGTPFVTDVDAREADADTDDAVVHLSAGRAPRS